MKSTYKVSTERLTMSPSLRTRLASGRPRTAWTAKEPRSKRDENLVMTGWWTEAEAEAEAEEMSVPLTVGKDMAVVVYLSSSAVNR